MNHRNPPSSSPPYQRNSSGNNGSFFGSGRRYSSMNDSSSYLDTGDLTDYHSTRNDDDYSMLYYKDKPVQHKSVLSALLHHIKKDPFKAVCFAAVAFSLLWGYRSRAQTARLLKELNAKTVDHAISKWKSSHKESRAAAANSKEMRELYAAQEKWIKRDTAWRHHMEKLQNHTQKQSLRAVLDRFGPGPHHVQIKVVLPAHVKADGNYTEEDYDTFEIEMAPLKEMPHSIHLFLDQVSSGLWDKPDISFHVNTEHILMGGPTTKQAREAFQTLGLAHLAFPEYSHSFPHEKYTLGFAGRPGGPSFYINLSNNTRVHGPGGQPQHALTEFADACFAKVVSGFNVLEEILDETDAKHRTLIISMKHIMWNEEYKLKDDEHWHKTLKELDVNLKDDDYTDDMYYDSADEAGIADDDHIRRDKKRLEDAEKEAAAGKEHVVQHHRHGEQYLEDMEALDMDPPEPIEPPAKMRVQLEEIKRKADEARPKKKVH